MKGIETVKEEEYSNKYLKKDNKVIKMRQKVKLSREAKLLNNFLYREAQLKCKFNSSSDNYFETTLTNIEIRKITGIENTNQYSEKVKTAITQLQFPIEIYDIVDDNGDLWKWQSLPFVVYAGEKQERKTGEISYTLKISDKMFQIIKESGVKNYTQIDLSIQKKLTSNGISMYEWFKSYQNMGGKNRKGYCPPMSLETINEIFFTKYKYLSKAKPSVFSAIEQINKETDIYIREVVNKENPKRGSLYFKVAKNPRKNKQVESTEESDVNSLINNVIDNELLVFKTEYIPSLEEGIILSDNQDGNYSYNHTTKKLIAIVGKRSFSIPKEEENDIYIDLFTHKEKTQWFNLKDFKHLVKNYKQDFKRDIQDDERDFDKDTLELKKVS